MLSEIEGFVNLSVPATPIQKQHLEILRQAQDDNGAKGRRQIVRA
jgi:hypothetical protein